MSIQYAPTPYLTIAFRPPGITRKQAEMERRNALERQPLRFKIEGAAFQISPSKSPTNTISGNQHRIGISIGDDVAFLDLEPGLIHVLQKMIDPELPFLSTDPELSGILFERLFEQQLEQLEPVFGTIKLGKAAQLKGPVETRWMTVTDSDDRRWPATLSASTAVTALIDDLWRERPIVHRPVQDLDAIVAVRVGRTSLSLSDLETLRPGDVIMTDSMPDEPGTFIAVVENKYAVIVQMNDGRLHAKGSLARLSTLPIPWLPMIEDLMEEQEKSDSVVRELPVELVFEVGRRSISVAELETINEGYVLELEKEISEAVDIRIHGRRIAVGELVLIEGRLGVRLTSINRNSADHTTT